MSSNKLPHYLRTYRKRSGLNQGDVAFLMGLLHKTQISRHENSAALPSFSAIVAYEVIFQVPLRDLFAGRYVDIEERIIERADHLRNVLTAKPLSPKTERVIDTLSEIITPRDLLL